MYENKLVFPLLFSLLQKMNHCGSSGPHVAVSEKIQKHCLHLGKSSN